MISTEPENLAALSDDDFKARFGELLTLAQQERQSNQLLDYRPVSNVMMAVHESVARVLGIGGGET